IVRRGGQPGRQGQPGEASRRQRAEGQVRVADHALDDQDQDDPAEVPGEQQEPDRGARPLRAGVQLGPVQGHRQGGPQHQPPSRRARRGASSSTPPAAGAPAPTPTDCGPATRATPTLGTPTVTGSRARRWSCRATACGTTAAPRIPATVMIAIRYPAALPRPKWPSIESSQVATALNTPIPTNSRPASTHRNRSPHSQRSDTATDGSPRNAAGVRTATSTQA